MKAGWLRIVMWRDQERASPFMHRPLQFDVIAAAERPIASNYGGSERKVQAEGRGHHA